MTQVANPDCVLELAGEGPEFIDAATLALAQGVRDDALTLELVRQLAAAGLLHRAACTLRLVSGAGRETNAGRELVSLLGGSGAGRQSWATRSGQFSANCALLRKKVKWVGEVESAWRAGRGRLELNVTRTGSYSVFQYAGVGTQELGLWRPRFAPEPPQPPASDVAAKIRQQVLSPFVINGAGLGMHLVWLWEATGQMPLGACPVLYQVESNWLALAVALHLADWTGPLADERVLIFAGPDAAAEFEASALADPWRFAPRVVFPAGAWSQAEETEIAERAQRVREREEAAAREMRRGLNTQRAGRDVIYWAGRFGDRSGRPLRVLGITSRFTTVLQYALRDALAALGRLGCETRLALEPSTSASITPRGCLALQEEFDPDLILLIDHTRPGRPECFCEHLPVVSWIQDRLPKLFDGELGKKLGPLDFCMGIAGDELCGEFNFPAERFFPCDMATDPGALLPPDGEVPVLEPDDEFTCDIAFASNFNGTSAALHGEFRGVAQPAARPLLDAIYEDLGQRQRTGRLNGGLDCGAFVARMESQVGVRLTPAMRVRVAGEFVRPLADRMLRQETVEWAIAWARERNLRLHLYGNGWADDARFAPFAQGFVPHGATLGRVFRAARINLHAGCNPAFHQRVLDGLAAGGFFLFRMHTVDTLAAMSRRVWEWMKARGATPPTRYSAADLPLELVQRQRRLRDLIGHDPDGTTVLSAADFAEFRALHETRTRVLPSSLWPGFYELVFETESEFRERAGAFLEQAPERRATMMAMRERVVETFTYDGLMARMLRWLGERLASAGRPGDESK